MTAPARPLPTTYGELRSMLENNVFPDERHWLDFKRQIYPNVTAGGQLTGGQKDKANEELACDMASMGVRGGYLIYGVAEDKPNHTFTVQDIPLPVGIVEAVDQIARSRITPPLSVIPTAVPNPQQPTHGLLVVEIPESPSAPHMVSGTYYGRSETGKERLTDDEVERLISRRGHIADHLRDAMPVTIALDPIPGNNRTSHFFLTAVPTQPRPEMFLGYTRDHQTRNSFIQLCTTQANDLNKCDGGQRGDATIAFAGLMDHRRTQHPRGAWFSTWSQEQEPIAGRAVGVEDDGIIRFIDLAAGSLPNGQHPIAASAADRGWPVAGPTWSTVYELMLYWRLLDMLRLIGHLATKANYHGGWLIGIELDDLAGRVSSIGAGLTRGGYDHDSYVFTIRATTAELTTKARDTAGRLIRPLFRDLGSESALPIGI